MTGCRYWLAAVMSAALLAGSAAQAQDSENEKRGFDAESVYSVGEIDTINHFSAGLSIVIPLGNSYPLSTRTASSSPVLAYSSKLWDYTTTLDPVTMETTRISVPTRYSNAGIGWSLNPGYFLEENNGSDILHEWNHSQYVSRDGAQHYFYDQLHEGDDDLDADTYYSRDNSSLRLKKETSPARWIVEFPNGDEHTFSYLEVEQPGNWQKWYLTRIEDRYGNWMAIDYGTQGSTWLWTITDIHGRSHTVTLTEFPDVDDYYVTEINLEAFGGTEAIYTLTYAAATISQACGADFPQSDVDVQYLTEIAFPDGQTYDMTDAVGNPRYRDGCGAGSGESGAILGITLPTRGQIEWDYHAFEMPHYFLGPNVDDASIEVRGVQTRRTLDEDDNVIGSWSYRRELVPPIPLMTGDPPTKEVRVHVEDPLGHCTTHYFDANTGNWDQGPNPEPGWSYGLPFSWDEPQSSLHYLSTQVFEEFGSFRCEGELHRSTYVLYEHDELPFLSPTPVGPLYEPWHETNRRVRSMRTVYNNDGNRFAATAFSDFDGVGHYRSSATSGNFDAGNVRQATTDFNPGFGTYAIDPDDNDPIPGVHTFIAPTPNDPWVLGTFERQTMTESGKTATATTCFDDDGFLTKRRLLVDDAAVGVESREDLIVEFEPDGEGNVHFERYFGGDTDHVNEDSDLCEINLFNPPYEIEHLYANGALSLSRYRDNGVPVAFNNVDSTIDPSTGLVAASRDIAGIETVFDYDTLGRLISGDPEFGHGARVDYDYSNATANNKAQVSVKRRPDGGGAVLFET